MFHSIVDAPVETQEIPDYEGPYDGQLPNNLEMEVDMPSQLRHSYNFRPKQKRSCSPAKRAATPPRTVPRLVTKVNVELNLYLN